jgi:hypothetical protein
MLGEIHTRNARDVNIWVSSANVMTKQFKRRHKGGFPSLEAGQRNSAP